MCTWSEKQAHVPELQIFCNNLSILLNIPCLILDTFWADYCTHALCDTFWADYCTQALCDTFWADYCTQALYDTFWADYCTQALCDTFWADYCTQALYDTFWADYCTQALCAVYVVCIIIIFKLLTYFLRKYVKICSPPCHNLLKL